MDTRGFGLIVIGDELLSGKRRDRHFPRLVELLAARGLELRWCRFIGDEPEVITGTLRETLGGDDIVFSCGGIGATPDDRTRQCVANALGIALAVHPEGLRELKARSDSAIPPQRLRLVEFPEGASIIPNPVNGVPGFAIAEHYFLPGFPSMAWPMMEWVLDHHYRHLHAPGARLEQAITVFDARESDVIPLMERFVAAYPRIRIACLPSTQPDRYQLELGLRGPAGELEAAMTELRLEVDALGFRWSPVETTR